MPADRRSLRMVAVLLGGVVLAALATGCGDAPAPPAARAPARLDLATVAVTARVGRDEVRGSGVVVDADAGLVLTSAHTVWGATSLRLDTAVGVLHGRLVARDACDDLALVETQPRLPGLAALPIAAVVPAGGALTAVEMRGRALRRVPVRAAGGPRPIRAGGPLILNSAVPLEARPGAGASGGPLLDAGGRVVGLVQAADRGVAVPGQLIAERLAQLAPGRRTVYVGWRDYYACGRRLHAFATAAHDGYRPADARLNAPVTATRPAGVRGPR